jgi:hypothetical protein
VIAWTLVALIGLVWAMVLLDLDPTPTAEAAADNLRQLWPLWITSAAVWIGLTGMWMILRRQLRDAATDQGRFWRSALTVLLVALGARAAVLTLHETSLSYDVYRYVFDGRNLAAGYNPYLVLPADRLHAPAERWPGERQLVPRLGFSELATPYLPVSEAVFGAIGLTIGTRWSTPSASARAFRVGFVVMELAMILIMVVVLKRAGRSAWWAALYAWHPLPISEVAGSGHQEAIGVACLVGSLAVFTIVPGKTWRWTAPLALSALGRPITLPAGAIMLRGRPLREWFVSAVIGAVVVIACIAPLWLIAGDHGRAYRNWRATVDQLVQRSAHFGGVYEGVLAAARRMTPADGRVLGLDLPPERLARNVCLTIFAAAAIGLFWSRSNAWQATGAMLFAVVLLAPVAFPWYLLWAFALFPMADSRALWVLSLTLPWGYAAWADAVHRKAPPWLLAVAYVPVLIVLAWDVARHPRRCLQGGRAGASP